MPSWTNFVTFDNSLAAAFNGTSTGAFMDDPSFKTDTQGSISMWSRATTVLSSAGLKVMMGYHEIHPTNGRQLQFSQRYNAGTPVRANTPIPSTFVRPVIGTSQDNGLVGDVLIVAGAMTHWLLQSNGTNKTFYINGVNVGTVNWFGAEAPDNQWFGNIGGTTHRLSFGVRYIGGSTYQDWNDCTMGQVTYVNRPRTPAEITAEYNGGNPRNPLGLGYGTSLKSYWPMNGNLLDVIGPNSLSPIGSLVYTAP